MVKVLKPFMNAGRIVHPGEQIEVDEGRHASLALNGLVEAPASAKRTPAKKTPVAKPARKPGVITSGQRPPRRRQLIG